MVQTICIGNDHGGVDLKFQLIEEMTRRGIRVINVGSDEPNIVTYPTYAKKVVETLTSGKADRGILICSTGIGMSIAANKYPGIRASLCTDEYMGKMTRAHNDSNILCLGGKITTPEIALRILDVWLNTEYEGGRHEKSLSIIEV